MTDTAVTMPDYRAVFNCPIGHKVFAHMLYELGFGKTGLSGERDLARLEVANRLLQLAGITGYEGLDPEKANKQRVSLITNMFNNPTELKGVEND